MNATNEIRPIIFEVLEKEVAHRSSQKTAEDRLSELCKSINADINRRREQEIDQARKEITFARLILAGLYAEKGSSLRATAEAFVKAAASDQAKCGK